MIASDRDLLRNFVLKKSEKTRNDVATYYEKIKVDRGRELGERVQLVVTNPLCAL